MSRKVGSEIKEFVRFSNYQTIRKKHMKKSKNFSETWRMKGFGNGAVDAKWTTEIHWQMMGIDM